MYLHRYEKNLFRKSSSDVNNRPSESWISSATEAAPPTLAFLPGEETGVEW